MKRVLKSDIVEKVGSEAGQPELLHALLQLQRAQYVLHNLNNIIRIVWSYLIGKNSNGSKVAVPRGGAPGQKQSCNYSSENKL